MRARGSHPTHDIGMCLTSGAIGARAPKRAGGLVARQCCRGLPAPAGATGPRALGGGRWPLRPYTRLEMRRDAPRRMRLLGAARRLHRRCLCTAAGAGLGSVGAPAHPSTAAQLLSPRLKLASCRIGVAGH